jgi:hypothetical protein
MCVTDIFVTYSMPSWPVWMKRYKSTCVADGRGACMNLLVQHGTVSINEFLNKW